MSNIVILPGLIDMHVHLRTPGQEEKEDFSTGTRAAIAGGFTLIFDMPNNKLPITTSGRLDEKFQLANGKVYSDIGFYFGSLGDNLDQFEQVKDKVYGLKLYLNETTGNFLIDTEKLTQIFDAWDKTTNKPILVHAEDDAVAAVIENVRRTKHSAHFCHISLKSDLEQIMDAKDEGLPITCGVTPHHLLLSEEDAKKLGPYGRMKPFLKSDEDVKFLWSNIKHIDVVESDHAPHTKADKDSDNPPFGVPGLETTLPLLLNAVHEGKIEFAEVKRLLHDGPKKVLGTEHDTGSIEVDTSEQYEISNDKLFTKVGWSPFAGRKLFGKVKKVTLHGNQVFDEETISEPPQGEVI